MKEDFDGMLKTFCRKLVGRFPAMQVTIPEDVLANVCGYLIDNVYPPKRVLKDEGKVEVAARLVLHGIGALYVRNEVGLLQLKRVYAPGDVMVDLLSFRSGEPSQKILVAYSDLRIAELTKQAEIKLLKDYPIMNRFSTLVSDFMKYEDERWIELISESHENRLGAFITFYPGICGEMLRKDVCQLLMYKSTTFKNVSAQTHFKDYSVDQARLSKILDHDFLTKPKGDEKEY